jgi:transcriptional regulator with XRE-family HTH domain
MKNELPNTLKKLLLENKITARQLAKETGMSISTVSDVMNGRQPSLKNLQLLATFFEVSLDYIVNGQESKIKSNSDELDFEDMFEGVVRIKISKLKDNSKKDKK